MGQGKHKENVICLSGDPALHLEVTSDSQGDHAGLTLSWMSNQKLYTILDSIE